jgi:hypothetical protein
VKNEKEGKEKRRKRRGAGLPTHLKNVKLRKSQ